jgi:Ni,Fe-hydrogenase III small subunit/ferredoxin
MPWIFHGVRNGTVTTRYPARRDDYADTWHGAVAPTGKVADGSSASELERLCPTGAIAVDDGVVAVDRGRCILCGLCTDARPDEFTEVPGSATARLHRDRLVVTGPDEPDRTEELRTELARRVRAFGRSVHVRHVDTGSDGSDEWELQALWNPVYDVQRLGIFLTASPRHADVLVVTGSGGHGMEDALHATYQAMPHPKVVMALGTDALSGGLVSPTYAVRGGVLDSLPVDVCVPGSPPSPFAILHGLLLVLGRLPRPEEG